MMTTHEPSLREDLSILAAEDRDQFGEPPTAEQLVALRDGELPEEEAERLRDLLAVDPEWASIYLELKSPPASEDSGDAGAVDVDGAWDRLSRRMEVPSIEDRKGNVDRPGAVPARETIRRFLPLAAGLFLGLGLVWAIINRSSTLSVPEGKIHEVRLSQEILRATSLRIPQGTTAVAFFIETVDVALPEKFVVELFDSQTKLVWSERFKRSDIIDAVRFEVTLSHLRDREAYRLVLRSSGSRMVAPILIEKIFLLESER